MRIQTKSNKGKLMFEGQEKLEELLTGEDGKISEDAKSIIEAIDTSFTNTTNKVQLEKTQGIAVTNKYNAVRDELSTLGYKDGSIADFLKGFTKKEEIPSQNGNSFPSDNPDIVSLKRENDELRKRQKEITTTFQNIEEEKKKLQLEKDKAKIRKKLESTLKSTDGTPLYYGLDDKIDLLLMTNKLTVAENSLGEKDVYFVNQTDKDRVIPFGEGIENITKKWELDKRDIQKHGSGSAAARDKMTPEDRLKSLRKAYLNSNL